MTEECITPLRRRMIENMSVRHFASKTQHDYIRTVMKLTRFLGRSPDTATVSEANMSNAFSSVDIGSQRFCPASAAQMKNVLKRPLAESTICSQRKPRGFRCSAQPAGSRPHSRPSMQQSRAPRHWHERKD
jgi:hypothetical protein